MKILYVGTITTSTVIVLGIALVVPAFFPQPSMLPVVLSLDVSEENNNVPQWCDDVSSIIKKYDIKAVVFVSGKIAQDNPQCVTDFPNKVDIGSETYDYQSLISIPDYSQKLEEVKKGKDAVDAAGHLDSRLFRAPYGLVDQNIYSLLTRSNIQADFSYTSQYDKYYNGQFLKFDLNSYDGNNLSSNFIKDLPSTNAPVMIYFDNTASPEKIDDTISKLKASQVKFVSASDLTGFDLTIRRGWLN